MARLNKRSIKFDKIESKASKSRDPIGRLTRAEVYIISRVDGEPDYPKQKL